MKQFKCSKCNSTDVFISKSGNNTGLYCSDCGKWIAWLNKDDLRLAERQIESQTKTIITGKSDVMELVNFREVISLAQDCNSLMEFIGRVYELRNETV